MKLVTKKVSPSLIWSGLYKLARPDVVVFKMIMNPSFNSITAIDRLKEALKNLLKEA